jgi:hypothetical protein
MGTPGSAVSIAVIYHFGRIGPHPQARSRWGWWRSGGTRPDRPNSLRARTSATSMMTTSTGSRSQMKLTTHPSHAEVCCIRHSSQLIEKLVMP